MNLRKKNIIILSEPRTGSHWLQSCLFNHYSLGELFNVKNIEHFEVGPDFALPSQYTETSLSESEMTAKLKERFQIYKSIDRLKSVKIHKLHLNQQIQDWLLQQDAVIINLERKNTEYQLRSLLIANHKKKFFGALEKDIITVSKENYLECRDAFAKNKDICKQFQKNSITLFYEDLLLKLKNDWFDPSVQRYVRQNSSEMIEIENWPEVQKWEKTFTKF